MSSKAIYLHIASAYRWFLYWGVISAQDPNLHIGAFREMGHAPNDDRLVRHAHMALPSVPIVGDVKPFSSPPARPVTLQDLEGLLQALSLRPPPSPPSPHSSPRPPSLGSPAPASIRAQLLVAGHRTDPEARPISSQQAELIDLVCSPNLSKDIIAAIRPSGGKTLAFEIAGRLRAVRTILFMVPLKSIAIDLVARMSSASVQAEFWSSKVVPVGGIVFFALEDAGSMALQDWIRLHQTRIHCIVLDEVHGAAVDGYRSAAWAHIHHLRQLTSSAQQRLIPLIGLSGSLTPDILNFTIQHFAFQDPVIIRGPLNIPHIQYSFHPIEVSDQEGPTREELFLSQHIYDLTQSEKNRLKALYSPSKSRTPSTPRPAMQTLVLFASVAEVNDAYETVGPKDEIGRYHSQVDPSEQATTLAAVRDGSCVLLFATSGAATGLDAAFTQVRSLRLSKTYDHELTSSPRRSSFSAPRGT